MATWQTKLESASKNTCGKSLDFNFKQFKTYKVSCTLTNKSLACEDIGDEELSLSGNNITALGAEYLGELLTDNSSLTSLDLRSNQLGDDGVVALMKGIRKNKHLKELSVCSNNIGDTGADFIRQALDYNTTLKFIELKENNISQALMNDIQQCASKNRSAIKNTPNRHSTYPSAFVQVSSTSSGNSTYVELLENVIKEASLTLGPFLDFIELIFKVDEFSEQVGLYPQKADVDTKIYCSIPQNIDTSEDVKSLSAAVERVHHIQRMLQPIFKESHQNPASRIATLQEISHVMSEMETNSLASAMQELKVHTTGLKTCGTPIESVFKEAEVKRNHVAKLRHQITEAKVEIEKYNLLLKENLQEKSLRNKRDCAIKVLQNNYVNILRELQHTDSYENHVLQHDRRRSCKKRSNSSKYFVDQTETHDHEIYSVSGTFFLKEIVDISEACQNFEKMFQNSSFLLRQLHFDVKAEYHQHCQLLSRIHSTIADIQAASQPSSLTFTQQIHTNVLSKYRGEQHIYQQEFSKLNDVIRKKLRYEESIGKQLALKIKVNCLLAEHDLCEIEIRQVQRRNYDASHLEKRSTDIQIKIGEYSQDINDLQSAAHDDELCEMFPDLNTDLVCSNFCNLSVTAGKLIQPDGCREQFAFCSTLYLTEKTQIDHVTYNGENFVIKEQDLGPKFLQECNHLSRLSHPNITKLYSIFFTNKGRACSLMPYFERGNLRPWVDSVMGRMDCVSDIKGLFLQIVSAVTYLHQSKVVHCYLRPEAILLNDSSEPVLCSFGTSRELQSNHTVSGIALATELIKLQIDSYTAPEVSSSDGLQQFSPATDMWSLGIMLAELLSGELFSWNPTLNTIVNSQQEQIDLHEKPGDAWDLVRQLLIKNPSLRVSAHNLLHHSFFFQAMDPLSLRGLPANEGMAANAYSALHTHLASLHRPDLPSQRVVISNATRLGQELLAHFRETEDVSSNIVVEVSMEGHPFAGVAMQCLEQLLMVTGSLLVDRCGGNQQFILPASDLTSEHILSEWYAIGKLLAKCVMDSVCVKLPFATVFYEYLVRGESCDQLESSLSHLAVIDPPMYEDLLRLQSLKISSKRKTYSTDIYPGCRIKGIVTDRLKRDVLQQWARYRIIESRKNAFDAARTGFLHAFCWEDQLRSFALHGPHFSILFSGAVGDSLRPEEIIKTLTTMSEVENDVELQHRKWLESFFNKCGELSLCQFMVRCTNQISVDEKTRIVIFLQTKTPQIHFYPEKCTLALPVCTSEVELVQKLSRVLNIPEHMGHTCVVCKDLYYKVDGICCSQMHFICNSCLEDLVGSQCKKNVAELMVCSSIVSCCECNEEISERNLLNHVSGTLFDCFKAKQMEIVTNKIHQAAEMQMKDRLQTELGRLAALSAEEREVERHRNHIVDNILTLHCPRQSCRQAYLDFSGCFALTCSRCKAGFCAKCQKDCGSDAHSHVQQCVGTNFGSIDELNQYLKRRRQEEAFKYLKTIHDAAIRQNVLDNCRKDFEDLQIKIVIP
eukprot:gene5799-9025_t